MHDSTRDDEGDANAPAQRKKSGYDSRVEQILYERPDLVITIVAAGKNVEGGGNYIVYTVRTGVCIYPFERRQMLTNAMRTGCRSQASLLRLLLAPQDPRRPSSHFNHSPHSGEAFYGRLCS